MQTSGGDLRKNLLPAMNPDDTDQAVWTHRDTIFGAGLILIPFLGIALLNAATSGSTDTSINVDDTSFAITVFVTNAFIEGIFLIAPFYYANRYGISRVWKALGGRNFNWIRGIGEALLAIIAVYALSFLYSYLFPNLQTNVDELVQQTGENYPLTLRATLLGAILIAPICEEIFFRGFLLQGLRAMVSTSQAIAISAIIFAIIHGSPGSFPILFTLGVLLAVLRVRSKSLWPGLILHIINNGIAAMYILWPWLFPEFMR
jgi:membrane protease YdiL (CAAX protease family)